MTRFFILISVLILLQACGDSSSSNLAQTESLESVEKKALTQEQAAISALEFLVGNWAGPGISYAEDGTQTAYHDTEYVRFDLGKSLLLINARGENPDGKTSYSLHTVISYDAKAQQYIYSPYSSKGLSRSFQCTLNAQPQFICLTDTQSYRLTFQRLEDGRWNEFGERFIEGQWVKNFETILSHAKP